MRILYISHYFPPEMGAPAARVSELARHWVNAKQRVTVLTGFPNHPTGVVPPDYRPKLRRLICREQMDGVDVVRTWLIPLPNCKPLERMVNYASFCLSSCLTGTFLRRHDVIIATSPQLLVGLTGWWLSRVRRVPFILEIRDLWPDSITAAGVGSQESFLTRWLRTLSDFLYRSCDHLVVVTPAFKEELVNKWDVPAEKISIVENGVESDLFTPHGVQWAIPGEPRLQGKFVVSYIGTLGLAHGLSTVLQAAAFMQKTFPDILFLFVGEGADKKSLIASARGQGLSNVRFMPQQSRADVPSIIRASDICLVLLKKTEVFKTVIPTKMLEFMACGRPVVLGVDGQARQVLDEAQAGIFVQPEDSQALAQAIIHLYQDERLRETLGRNGCCYIRECYSRKQKAQIYSSVLKEIIRRWKKHQNS
jgi:colanic acid biosynthesis glycosyl transferase WcaI